MYCDTAGQNIRMMLKYQSKSNLSLNLEKSALMICILRLIDSTEIQTVRLIGTVRLIETTP